ncbi:MAG: hypothetical protein KTR31_29405 [Myxococcales bacterium]|nr:hypothetical protein [Myxococcales bacterium]
MAILRWLLPLPLLPVFALAAYVAMGPSAEERATTLLEEQATLWEDPELRRATTAALRYGNPEWDFMRRTFLVLSLVDRSLAHPEEADRWLPLVDSVIDDTVAVEAASGHGVFLLPYWRARPFRDPEGRSLFVDGEIALMLGARRFVRDDPALAAAHQERVAQMVAAFYRSPAALPESYPDEAWLFCVTNALVAIHLADVLDGTDHSAVIRSWLARTPSLMEPVSGLLGSEFTWSGEMLDGPEGSSLWLVAINLLLLDETLAEEQYTKARSDLMRAPLGFGYAREWGSGWQGPVDIDSGPIVPILNASPSSSGFALMAARAFDDERSFRALARSLRAADLLQVVDPRFAQLASNPMGDVVLLHATTFGPLWQAVRQRR